MIQNKLEKLVREWHNGGFARVNALLLRRLGLIRLVILGRLDSSAVETQSAPDGYRFSLAEETQCPELAECSAESPDDSKRLTALYRELFASGHRCAIASYDGKIVGQVWAFANRYVVTIDDYRHTRLTLRLDDRSIFTGNAYVAVPHRNRGLFRNLKLFLMRQYPPGTRFYTWTDQVNSASLSANHALGFESIATLRFSGKSLRSRASLRHRGDRAWMRLGRPWPTLSIVEKQLRR